MYSQNNEEKVILDYFMKYGTNLGVVLDIGANDGQTFSNSLALIKKNWAADLIEPSPTAFAKLLELHKDNSFVKCHNFAVGLTNGKIILHESGAHLPDNSDVALLSTTEAKEKTRWKNVNFKEVEVKCVDVRKLFKKLNYHEYDFITIDAEGLDLIILTSLDLSHTNMICIEHNGDNKVIAETIAYCKRYGMEKELLRNAENIIIAR